MKPTHLFRTCRRFRVGPTPDDFRDRYIAALNENAFREPLTTVSKEQRVGWCQLQNPLDTDFNDVNRWLFNQYAMFALRVDEKRLPAKLLRAHLDHRTNAWCQANSRERCPSKVKAEIKEQLEMEMLQKTLPTMSAYGAVWNIQEGWVTIAATSTTRLDSFRKLFHRTFGLVLSPADPLDGVSDDIARALVSGGGTDFRLKEGVYGPSTPPEKVTGVWESSEGGDESEGAPPHLAAEFLVWLLWLSSGPTRLDLGEGNMVDLFVEGKVDLRQPGEERNSVSVALEDPSAAPVLTALAGGSVVKALTLGIRCEDREYSVRLSGTQLDRSAVKLPSLVRVGDTAEQLYEAAFLYEELHHILTGLFGAFATQRVDGWSQRSDAIRRWIGGKLAVVFEVDEATGQSRLFGRMAS